MEAEEEQEAAGDDQRVGGLMKNNKWSDTHIGALPLMESTPAGSDSFVISQQTILIRSETSACSSHHHHHQQGPTR